VEFIHAAAAAAPTILAAALAIVAKHVAVAVLELVETEVRMVATVVILETLDSSFSLSSCLSSL